MNIVVGSTIRLKSGIDVKVTDIPGGVYFHKGKFYCRTTNKQKEFKVVMRDDILFVHPTQPTLKEIYL